METLNVLVDRPRTVREGEALDSGRLLQYLKSRLPELKGQLTIEQFPAGFSNLTYLLRIGEDELVLRRPPIGANIKSAHDMNREYTILSHLYPVYPKVPRPLLFCEDDTVLGSPFYMMERVRGIVLRAQAPRGIELAPQLMRRLSESFIANLVEIHQVDYKTAGLGDLGQPEGYVARQVDGWTRRYLNARTDELPNIEKLANWLKENQPRESARTSLIHNDYKYDNVVLSVADLATIVAVLDWEMATIGDPLMDLGTTLGYWVDAGDTEQWQRYGFAVTKLAGNLTRGEIAERYAILSGSDPVDLVFYYAYGLFKIAVIVQQIYARYQRGITKDARFSYLGKLVEACGDQAQRSIEKKRIDSLG